MYDLVGASIGQATWATTGDSNEGCDPMVQVTAVLLVRVVIERTIRLSIARVSLTVGLSLVQLQ